MQPNCAAKHAGTVSLPSNERRWAAPPSTAASTPVAPRSPKSWSLEGTSGLRFPESQLRSKALSMASRARRESVATEEGYQECVRRDSSHVTREGTPPPPLAPSSSSSSPFSSEVFLLNLFAVIVNSGTPGWTTVPAGRALIVTGKWPPVSLSAASRISLGKG